MESPDPFREDVELADMLRRLRFERDQELAELEDEAERLEAKQSDLPRVAMRAMMAGEVWSVSFGERTFDGHVVHVGSDFVSLQDVAGNLLDIAFSTVAVISHVGAVQPGRAPTTLRPVSFRGRLLALQEGRPVELGGSTGSWSLTGVIESVNVDHLSVSPAGGVAASVPLSSVGFVLRRPTVHRRGH